MRKVCSVFLAILAFMSIFAVGTAAESSSIAMEEVLFLQRGVTTDRNINLWYFEKLDTDEIFWTVDSERLFTIDNDGVITFDQFAAFFGGTTVVQALDKNGNVLGQTKVVVTWKWFYYMITYLSALVTPLPSWIGWWA